jgi:5-methylcytosine-specific restriction endonuclease McrA
MTKPAPKKNEFRLKTLEFLRRYKQRSGCRLCGENSSPDALDFHHINPNSKTMTVTRMVRNSSILDTLEEVEKCVVLCSNCHRKMHAESSRKKVNKKSGEPTKNTHSA